MYFAVQVGYKYSRKSASTLTYVGLCIILKKRKVVLEVETNLLFYFLKAAKKINICCFMFYSLLKYIILKALSLPY